MAKAPRAGQCKTRLAPAVTPAQSASLGAAFLADVTANLAAAARSAPIMPYLAFAPAGTETCFEGIVHPGTRMLLADGAPPVPEGVEKFGRCLLHAIKTMLDAGHLGACVLNADSPTLPLKNLLAAEAALAAPGDRVVMGEADDGGYYLLGMKQAHAHLFTNIDWSTARVAAQTRARAQEAGLDMVELERFYDVDDPASLLRLIGELRGARNARLAPHTAACLKKFDLLGKQLFPLGEVA